MAGNILPFPGNQNVSKSKAPTPPPKTVQPTEVMAEATGMQREVFQATDRNGLESSVLQGQVAKKLGAKTTEVQVRKGGLTFTGKALDKLKETAFAMTAAKAGELSGPPSWTRDGWNQLHVSVWEGPEGKKGEMDHPSPIVTDPNPKSGLITGMSYLISDGPKTS